MKTITAQTGQTICDIALQEMGDVSRSFDILAINPYLRLDMSIPAGAIVFVPETVINSQVVDYYIRGGIKPVSGLGEEISLNIPDMTYITQKLDYDLAGGDKEFEGIRLWNLSGKVTIQINYHGITAENIRVAIQQSLDGISYDTIYRGEYLLIPTLPSHVFNVLHLKTNYVRVEVVIVPVIGVSTEVAGVIDEIIWKV